MKLPNWLYDILKWLCILALPATKIAIPKLFDVWGWAGGEQIAETLDIVEVWLGSIVGIGCVTYYINNQAKEVDDKVNDVEDIDHQAEALDDTDKG